MKYPIDIQTFQEIIEDGAWNEIWIFEFKLNKTAEIAYNQIINKNYAAHMHIPAKSFTE